MKKSCIALAFLVATSCATFAKIPTTAEEWYTPSDGFKDCEGTAEITYSIGKSETGQTITGSLRLKTDSDGLVADSSIAELAKVYPDLVQKTSLMGAIYKIMDVDNTAKRNSAKIKTLGKNLNDVFSVKGIKIQATSKDGGTYTQTIRFSGGTLGEAANGKDADGTVDAQRDQDLYGIDHTTLAINNLTKEIEIKGFSAGLPETAEDLATVLKKPNDGKAYKSNGYGILLRTGGGTELQYMPIGHLGDVGAACDDVSVTTNYENGAISSGAISLYGYRQSGAWSIPTTGSGASGNFLTWKTLSDLADGTSIAARTPDGDDGGCPKLEVAGAHDYAGKSKNHYFGTSQGDGAAVGWWELPNVTTNMVVGDEATVTAGVQMPGAVFDESTKVIGLLGWNYSYNGSVPLVPVNAGGKLRYIGADQLASTNGVLCACPPKWDALLKWTECGEVKTVDEVTEDGVTNAVETIEFDPGTMTDFLKGRKFMFVDASGTSSDAASAVSGQWIVNEDGVTAPTLAPGNWDDGKTIGLNSNGAFQIAGFETADEKSACGENIAAQLANGLDSHLFLAKHEKTGEFHYVHAGSFTNFVPLADGMTIVTNAPSHEGELAISGAHESKNSGKALFSTGVGVVWKNPDVGVKVVGTDGSTNWVDANGNDYTNSAPAQTITFASQTNSNVRVWVSGTKDNATVTIGVYYK